MKSFYELSMKEALKLEKEFLKLELGHRAHTIWITNNIMGITLASLASIYLIIHTYSNFSNNFYILAILLLFLGLSIVYSATYEYHRKLNSWLRTSKKIIRD